MRKDRLLLVATAVMATFFLSGMPADAKAPLGTEISVKRPEQTWTAPGALQTQTPPRQTWMQEEEFDPEPADIAPAGIGDADAKLNLDLRNIPEELKTPETCLKAVKESALNLKFVPDRVMSEEICRAAVKSCGWALEFVPERFKTPELCMAAVKNFPAALEFVPDRLKTAEMCRTAVKEMPGMLECVPDRFKTPEMCAEAVAGIHPIYKEKMLGFVPAHMKAEVMRRAEALARRKGNK